MSDIVKYVIVVLVVVAVVWWVAKRILPNVRRGRAAEGTGGIAGNASATEGADVAKGAGEGAGGIVGDANAAKGAGGIADSDAGQNRGADGNPESQNR